MHPADSGTIAERTERVQPADAERDIPGQSWFGVIVASTAGAIEPRRSADAVACVATNAGRQGIMLSLAADFAADQVRANCLIIGTVATPVVAHLGGAGHERRRTAVPLQTEGTGWTVPEPPHDGPSA